MAAHTIMHQRPLARTLEALKRERKKIRKKFKVSPNYPGSGGWDAVLYLDYYSQAEYAGFCQLSPLDSPADREYSRLTKQIAGLRDEIALLKKAA